MVEVIVEKCIKCGVCVKACPFGAIEMNEEAAVIDADKCTICGACVSACKFDAIFIRKESNSNINVSDYKGVWVYAEQRNGELAPVVFELLGKGRELAEDLEVKLSAVLLGSNVKDLATELIAYGAEEVICVDQPELKDFCDEPYAEALSILSKKYKPEIILSGATVMGRSFIPRVAVALNTGLTADCTSLEIDANERKLLQTRPAFGGNIMATIECTDYRPQMATVRHKVMDPIPRDENRKGEIIFEQVEIKKQVVLTKFLESVKDITQGVNLTEANIIVAGGRGLKDKKNFAMIEELASLLGGAVGASRAAVDSEWITYPHQVGQTGKTLKPTIYIAIGISGAIQHLAGMQSSDYIIAINKDSDAPIFKVADLGIVGDLFEIVPELIKSLKG